MFQVPAVQVRHLPQRPHGKGAGAVGSAADIKAEDGAAATAAAATTTTAAKLRRRRRRRGGRGSGGRQAGEKIALGIAETNLKVHFAKPIIAKGEEGFF